MFTEDKITEIFCIADDFCRFFDAQMRRWKNIPSWTAKSANITEIAPCLKQKS